MDIEKPTITAFKNSPDQGAGLTRDFRIRWALEEIGQPYNVRLVSFEEMKTPEHIALQPFGQIPTYEQGELAVFETGAILLHLAECHRGLLPADPMARTRAISWIFAAVNTVEPPIVDREIIKYYEHGRSWQGERFAMADQRIRCRLDQLTARLGTGPWLVDHFSAADIMMVHVLRRLEGSGILTDYPDLMAYIARAQARPAYRSAFADQLALFTDKLSS